MPRKAKGTFYFDFHYSANDSSSYFLTPRLHHEPMWLLKRPRYLPLHTMFPVFKVSLVSLLLVRLLALILSMIHYAMRHSQQHMCSSVLKSSSYPCFASINQTLLSSFSEGLFVRRRRTFYIGKTWATKSLCQAAVPEE